MDAPAHPLTAEVRSSHRLTFFEGLRGVAAVMVLVHHLRLAFFEESAKALLRQWLAAYPYPLIRPVVAFLEGTYNGTFAVWLFWVMSAYVLSLQFFLRNREKSLSQAHDYLEQAALRRYPRLFVPVAASVLFAYVLMAAGLMKNVELANLPGLPFHEMWIHHKYQFPPSLAEAGRFAAWHSFFDFSSAAHRYNVVVWSMEKEFYGSLFLFAFLGIFGHRRSRLFIYPLALLVNFTLGLHWLNAFVAGIALCDGEVNQLPALNRAKVGELLSRWPWLNAGAWVTLVVLIGLSGYAEVPNLLLAVAVIVLTLFSRASQRFLARPSLAFLGRLSFSLYLIHVPILCSFSCWLYLRLAHSPWPGMAGAITVLASVAVCGLAAWGLYHAADQPGMALARRFSALFTKARP